MYVHVVQLYTATNYEKSLKCYLKDPLFILSHAMGCPALALTLSQGSGLSLTCEGGGGLDDEVKPPFSGGRSGGGTWLFLAMVVEGGGGGVGGGGSGGGEGGVGGGERDDS